MKTTPDGLRRHKLLPKDIAKTIPPLYWTEKQNTASPPLVYAKFFSPFNDWRWFVLEYDGDDTFFGLVVGWEAELGYFSLKDLSDASITLPDGTRVPAVERDLGFEVKSLDEVKKDLAAVGALAY